MLGQVVRREQGEDPLLATRDRPDVQPVHVKGEAAFEVQDPSAKALVDRVLHGRRDEPHARSGEHGDRRLRMVVLWYETPGLHELRCYGRASRVGRILEGAQRRALAAVRNLHPGAGPSQPEEVRTGACRTGIRHQCILFRLAALARSIPCSPTTAASQGHEQQRQNNEPATPWKRRTKERHGGGEALSRGWAERGVLKPKRLRT
mmetsp:Transcript_113256/g.293150  ORF Transcript_113256/g.293150 Transcript_113256/m.293150 type:complete len:205 (-) Transcript_113256:4-618(-)